MVRSDIKELSNIVLYGILNYTMYVGITRKAKEKTIIDEICISGLKLTYYWNKRNYNQNRLIKLSYEYK